MSPAQNGHVNTQQQVPRCQFCGADPMPIIPAFTRIGSGDITVFICAGCRAVHGVQLTGVREPEKSLIEVPGRM